MYSRTFNKARLQREKRNSGPWSQSLLLYSTLVNILHSRSFSTGQISVLEGPDAACTRHALSRSRHTRRCSGHIVEQVLSLQYCQARHRLQRFVQYPRSTRAEVSHSTRTYVHNTLRSHCMPHARYTIHQNGPPHLYAHTLACRSLPQHYQGRHAIC